MSMQVKSVFERLRQFDAYPKTLEDFRIKTFGGAIVTVVSGILMCILFISELNYYLTKEIHPELFVDTSRGQKLKINIDIIFHRLPCAYLSIDAMDVSGEQQNDVSHNILKQRIDLKGMKIDETPEKQEIGQTDTPVENVSKPLDPNRCESCYGAETPEAKCCNTCEQVREAYRKKGWAFNTPENIEQCIREGWSSKMLAQKDEGCKLFGYLEVNKVAGNFHFAPGKSFQQHHVHVHDLQAFGGQKFNTTHTVNHLSFGNDYPGILNPLDGLKEIANEEQMMFQYFVKVVPTTYTHIGGDWLKRDHEKSSVLRGFRFTEGPICPTLYTNQYSVTKHSKTVSVATGDSGLPGVFFMYELSPMMVKYTEKQRSFMHFLTGVCAIIGGVFTVAGLIDSLIYHSARAIQKKIDLGKAS